MQWILIPFGWAFIAVSLGVILIPYLRQRSDLLTSWNLFLFGSANFVGFSAIQSGYNTEPYVDYEQWDYVRFVAGAVTFYGVCACTYFFLKTPRRQAGKRFRKWPSQTVGVLFLLLPACVGAGLLHLALPVIPGISQVVAFVAKSAALIAVAYAFVSWYRQPTNPLLLWCLVGIVAYSLFFALLGGSGRRDLLSLAMTIPICLYWLRLRYTSRGLNVTVLLVAAFLILMLLAGYSTIRHQRYGLTPVERTVDMLRQLPSAIVNVGDTKGLLGSNAVEASLATIHLYTTEWDPQPFFNVWFILVNPVPRSVWPSKPESLGQTLPRDLGWWRYGYVNWGPGIVGHGYHEGGLHMLVFYGVFLGMAFRFFDELLMRQSGNPFLLGIMSAIAGQIIAYSRGDIGVFSMQIASGVITGLMLSYVARVFFGTGMVYPSDEDRISQMANFDK